MEFLVTLSDNQMIIMLYGMRGRDTYHCKGPWNDQCNMNVTTMVCTCKRWELTGIPRKHDVAATYKMSSHVKEVGIPEDWVA